jgi:GTPase SAR1 family protein
MGLVPVHCACLESDGDGLLIAGVSGVGKSTLSMALCEEGFNYVSDDWTYMSLCHDRIVAHGTSAPVRLLPDGVLHFQSLQRHCLQMSMCGELAYEIDIAEAFGARVQRECEPKWLLFLEKRHRAGTEFEPMSIAETRSCLSCSVERPPVQLPEAAAVREEMIRGLSLLPAWRFRYGGTPQFAAKELREFVVNRQQEVYA